MFLVRIRGQQRTDTHNNSSHLQSTASRVLYHVKIIFLLNEVIYSYIAVNVIVVFPSSSPFFM